MISLQNIPILLLHYKYFILLPLAIIEGPIITIIAGFLISLHYLNFLASYLVIVAGDLTGDTIMYAAGRWGRAKFIDRWGRFWGITPERVAIAERHFVRHSGKSFFLGKLAHGIGGVVLVAAGVARVPYSIFIWYNTLATFPKSLILLLIGFYFGAASRRIHSFLDALAFATVGLIAISVITYYLYRSQSDSREP